MGHGMAQRLLDRGHDLSVWNRTPEGAADLGARVAATPREAASGASFVLLSVADGDALRGVTRGADGVLAGLGRDAVLVNTSTVDPAEMHALARPRTAATSSTRACSATSTTPATASCASTPAARPRRFARCHAVLDDLGKEVVHVGALGAGMELKLVLNLVMGLEMQALAEAAAFGESRGLDRTLLLQAIAGSGFASPVMRSRRGGWSRAATATPTSGCG